MLFGMSLDAIGITGIILLIGIVKKNGIMLVDFALARQRERGRGTEEAVHEACRLRFRPILMTTMCALLAGWAVGQARRELLPSRARRTRDRRE